MVAIQSQKLEETLEWKRDDPEAMEAMEAPASKLETRAALRPHRGPSSNGTAPADEDQRIQPWQSLMDEIERESSLSPPGSDFFPCQQGFFAHSLAG